MSELQILKASAGSGKTYNLTKQYLGLLFSNPLSYRQTLAVTFTNKAAGEMKTRIISKLFELANYNNNSNKKPDYLDYILNENSDKYKNYDEVKKQAKLILQKIIHDYSYFHVNTIDTFFQKIIRTFSREMGLESNFTIELDTNKVVEHARDKLIFNLGNKKLTQEWIYQLAEENIKDGKSWDFETKLDKLSGELSRESFLNLFNNIKDKISDKNFLDYYKNALYEIINKFENEMSLMGSKALRKMEDNQITHNMLKGQYPPSSFFNKLRDKTEFKPSDSLLANYEDVNKWVKKGDNHLFPIAESVLIPEMRNIVQFFNENYPYYVSAKSILDNIYSLGILTDLRKEILEYSRQNNIFLISDSNHLINTIVKNSDTPFIFEKTGIFIKNYMLDEFQDTSETQWENFKPLIENSISLDEGNFNTIVGDIKQSIYRWRNGNWKILHSGIYNSLSSYTGQIKTNSLDTNYRSRGNIISFNNSLFKNGAQILQNYFNNSLPKKYLEDKISELIRESYNDVEQKPAKNDYSGYIEGALFNKDEYENEIFLKLEENILSIQDKNHPAGDIAILVRKTDEAKKISNMLGSLAQKHINSNYCFDFISGDSLMVSNSPSVKLIISALRYINNSEDVLNNALLTRLFNYSEDITLNKFNSPQINQELIKKLQAISNLSIFEITEKIILFFSLNKRNEEKVYLESFQNIVYEYSKDNPGDIFSFLNWWDETGKTKAIPFAESNDSIKIITIHKSKGLQFKNVIIPYTKWHIDHDSKKTQILWLKPGVTPFNKIEYLPVKYKKELANSIFRKDYFIEKSNAFIDNFNILYVAFTRAVENLFFYGEKEKKDSFKKISTLIRECISRPPLSSGHMPGINLYEHFNNEKSSFSYGTITKNNKKEIKKDDEEYPYHAYERQINIAVSSDEMLLFDNKEEKNMREYGNQMHELLKDIKVMNDIHVAVNKMIDLGVLNQRDSKIIADFIESKIKTNKKEHWFSDKYNILTERNLVTGSQVIVRPDRVLLKDNLAIIIDYKFGKKEINKHIEQINSYKSVIEKMGYKTEAYIWYFMDDEIIEV